MNAEVELSNGAPARGETALEFRLLGPLEVRRQGEALVLGGPRQRALLALLCLRRRTVVSVDEFVDELWGESPPATAGHMVEVYVSKLRKILGSGILVTCAPGYLLELDADWFDIARFESLLEEGSEALDRTEPHVAADRLREALGLWRGQALADFRYEHFAQTEIARLTDLRHLAEEQRIEAELGLGRAAELVAEIEMLVAAQPLRERRHRQLMLALYRAGRQADALSAYRRTREALVDELGIEPGPDLQAIERAILNQDEAVLALPDRRTQADSKGRLKRVTLLPHTTLRRALLGAALAGALVAAAATSGFGLRREGAVESRPLAAPVAVVPNSVAVIDPDTAEVVADVRVGRTPGPVVFGNGAVWVGNYEDKTISRIDPYSRAVVTLGIGVRPYGLAIGEGALWVTTSGTGISPATVTRRDLISDRIDSIKLGAGHPVRGDLDPRGAPSLVGRAMPVAVEGDTVWAGRRYYSQVVKIDGSTGDIVRRIRGPDPASLAATDGNVWVVNFYDGTVWRIDADSGHVAARIPVGEAPCCVAATDGAIWVVSGRTEVWRISPRSNSVEGTVDVGEIPVAIDAGEGAVWVANYGDPSISRIDALTHQVTTTKLARRPVGIAVGGGAVWVTVD